MTFRDYAHVLRRKWIFLMLIISAAVIVVERTSNKGTQYVSEISFLFEPESIQELGSKVRFKKRWVTLSAKNIKKISRYVRAKEAKRLRTIIGGNTFRSKILLDTVTYKGVEDLLANHMLDEFKEKKRRKKKKKHKKTSRLTTSDYSSLSREERDQLGMIGYSIYQVDEIVGNKSESDIISLKVMSGQYGLTRAIGDIIYKKLPELMAKDDYEYAKKEIQNVILELRKEEDMIDRQMAKATDQNSAITSYSSTLNIKSFVRSKNALKSEIRLYERILDKMSFVRINPREVLTPLNEFSAIYEVHSSYKRNMLFAVVGSIVLYIMAVIGFVFLASIFDK